MGNRLRDLFRPTKTEDVITLSFNNQAEMNRFLKELDNIQKTGCSCLFNDIKLVERSTVVGENRYPKDCIQSTGDMLVAPARERIAFPVCIDGKDESIPMERTMLEQHCIVETVNPFCVYIRLVFDLESNQLHITNKLQWENAINCEMFARDIKKAMSLIDSVVQHPSEWTENEKQKSKYLSLLRLLEMAIALEKRFLITFSPQIIRTNMDQWILLSRLYQMLEKGKIIRDASKINYIDAGYSEEIDADEIAISYYKERTYQLFDQNITVHLSNVLFNVCVGKSEILPDGKKRISFFDKQDNPMYGAHRAFVSKDEAITELEIVRTDSAVLQSYQNATEQNDVFVDV